ncbi:MAG TPA: prepilin peptidase [Rhodospirillaceae bacterium]|jgi:leader peptidase (prepilin peptidase)/N-methyltransferase|nr:prepilin peptidase [Alphaproteobacteria bacterium]HBH26489.1 prepilin peptidase [Rhodospirillaceae bacterium]
MWFVLFLLLGLALGSFATALAARAEAGRTWTMFTGRSACPACGTTLTARDLVPVLSWLLARGRCRHCGARISPAYPATEVGCALAALAIYATHGATLESALLMAALPLLAALLLVDLRAYLLPDILVMPIGLMGLWLNPGLEHIAAAALYAALPWAVGWAMSRVLKKDALGLGDVKFCAAAGAWLGLGPLPWFFVVAGVAGIALGATWRWAGRGAAFPFGPALIAALAVLLLWP